MMKYLSFILGSGILIPLCIFDLKKKKVPVMILLCGILVGAGYDMYVIGSHQGLIEDIILATTPGIFLLLLSYLTGEKIGKGDALCLLFVGEICGLIQTSEIFMIAVIMSAITGGLLLLCKKVKKETEIPFIPFITIGFWITRAITILQ